MRKATIFAAVAALLLGITMFPALAQATVRHITIQNFTFTPARSQIMVGDTVTWTNRDAVQHTSTSDNGVWDSGLIPTNGSFSFVFSLQGVYPYHCTPHPFMRDTIIVSTPTGIDESGTTPSTFDLGQNYPNPFNAQTTINFTINQPGHAKLEVMDILGRNIGVLLDQNMEPGSYDLTWDAKDKTSGVFFYRLSLNNQSKIGRMTLLK